MGLQVLQIVRELINTQGLSCVVQGEPELGHNLQGTVADVLLSMVGPFAAYTALAAARPQVHCILTIGMVHGPEQQKIFVG